MCEDLLDTRDRRIIAPSAGQSRSALVPGAPRYRGLRPHTFFFSSFLSSSVVRLGTNYGLPYSFTLALTFELLSILRENSPRPFRNRS